jgi:hypothetical protein
MAYGESIKTWNVELDDQQHSFRFVHQFWTGEKKYYINEELIKHISGSLLSSASFASDVPINIGTHEGEFKYRAVGRVAFYDLYIDGNKIEGEERNALRAPVWFIAFLLLGLLVVGVLSS